MGREAEIGRATPRERSAADIAVRRSGERV
jgi:hypothetical protein